MVSTRAGDTFNFWRTSAAALLDDDPIDTAVTSDKVSVINFGLPWLGSLFAYSDNAQFNLTADPILTPKTISVASASEFANSDVCPPITVGTYTYFPVKQGEFTSFQEYFLSDNVNGLYDAEAITNHVPAYVPANTFRLIASSALDSMIALTEDSPNELFIYKWYWQGNEKLQSSWSRWRIEEDSTILWAEFIDSTLHLTVLYGDGPSGI